jgi:hypothetical protein
MSWATVYEIFDRIEQLSAEACRLLDDLLAGRDEREWREEAARARRTARERSIDQNAIDQAVHAMRYG